MQIPPEYFASTPCKDPVKLVRTVNICRDARKLSEMLIGLKVYDYPTLLEEFTERGGFQGVCKLVLQPPSYFKWHPSFNSAQKRLGANQVYAMSCIVLHASCHLVNHTRRVDTQRRLLLRLIQLAGNKSDNNYIVSVCAKDTLSQLMKVDEFESPGKLNFGMQQLFVDSGLIEIIFDGLVKLSKDFTCRHIDGVRYKPFQSAGLQIIGVFSLLVVYQQQSDDRKEVESRIARAESCDINAALVSFITTIPEGEDITPDTEQGLAKACHLLYFFTEKGKKYEFAPTKTLKNALLRLCAPQNGDVASIAKALLLQVPAVSLVDLILATANPGDKVDGECCNPRCINVEETPGEYQVCSACRSVRYCGAVCQKAHWKSGHKKECVKKPTGKNK